MSVKPVTNRKAQKSTGSTNAQNGTKSEWRSQRPSESGSKQREPQKKEWKWQRGIVAHPLCESQWNRRHFSMTEWSPRSTKAGVHQQRVSRVMLPLTAPCQVPLASGEHVVGQWYSWTTMKRCGPCMGCTARWKQNLRSSAPSRGLS